MSISMSEDCLKVVHRSGSESVVQFVECNSSTCHEEITSCTCEVCNIMKNNDCENEKFKLWFEIINLFNQIKSMIKEEEKVKLAISICRVVFRQCMKYYDISFDKMTEYMSYEYGDIYKVLHQKDTQIIQTKCLFEIVKDTIKMIDD